MNNLDNILKEEFEKVNINKFIKNNSIIGKIFLISEKINKKLKNNNEGKNSEFNPELYFNNFNRED